MELEEEKGKEKKPWLFQPGQSGNPIKYTPDVVDKSLEYLQKWESLGDKVPSVIGLAVYLGRSRSTLYKWKEEEGKEEFKEIMELINTHQERTAWNKGLSGDFNARLTVLLLQNHGYSERQDFNHGGQEGSPPIKTKHVIEIVHADTGNKNTDTGED